MQEETTDKVQVAVFDFDGTSIEGSSPSWLVNRLIFEHKITPVTSLKIGMWGIAYKWHLPQSESWVRGQVFTAFEGKPKAEVDRYLIRFYDEWIARRFRPKLVAVYDEQAARDFRVAVADTAIRVVSGMEEIGRAHV